MTERNIDMIEKNGNIYPLIRKMLEYVDSEFGHDATKKMLKLFQINPVLLNIFKLIVNNGERIYDERLEVEVNGIKLENPLMVGAGWDKNADVVLALHIMGAAGVEVGSVLEKYQPGNPKPRAFKSLINGDDTVVLNRYGFNSPGMEVVNENLKSLLAKLNNLRFLNVSAIPEKFLSPIIGISLGKNKEVIAEEAPQAHARVLENTYFAADYFVINVSSPNTPGLRALQDKGPLNEIIHACVEQMEKSGGLKPLFVKIAPDLTSEALDDVIGLVKEWRNKGVKLGIIACNTTSNSIVKKMVNPKWGNEMGGLSGDFETYKQMVLDIIRHIHKADKDIPIVGVGGISSAKDLLRHISAGADATQLVSGLVGKGPKVFNNTLKDLIEFMNREGLRNLKELKGQSL